MARKKHEVSEVEVVEATPDVPEVSEVSEVSVYGRSGGYVRTFSKEAHGEMFMELAKGYAAKIKGSLK